MSPFLCHTEKEQLRKFCPDRDLAMPKSPRRLFDEIVFAFHQACDQRDSEIALELLRVLDFMAMRHLSDGEVRRNKHGVVAAHERFWEIQHPPY